ncbi:MAG: type II toxin-antitoxin system VapC family toxin [Capsulimonadaceae bacterium]
MTIDMALSGVGRIGLDTAAVIYFVEAHPKYDPLVTDIFQRISSGLLVAFTSVITVTEVLAHPYKLLNPVLAQSYRDVLLNSANLSTIEIDSQLADDAARLRAQYGLRTPDALQIAVALATGCQAFLTNDRGIKRVNNLRVLLLDELSLT